MTQYFFANITHDINKTGRHLLPEISIYNHFHNILRLSDVLPNFPHQLPKDLRLTNLGN